MICLRLISVVCTLLPLRKSHSFITQICGILWYSEKKRREERIAQGLPPDEEPEPEELPPDANPFKPLDQYLREVHLSRLSSYFAI